MSDVQIDSYKQVGNVDPVDSYVPGEGKQRIDLDEFFKETVQEENTVMVQGYEAFTFGKISRDLVRRIGLADPLSYDPFPSERNARAGNEGFFSMVAEKFESMIEGIIKYVRMVIDWVVDTIGGFLGFRKKSKITAESTAKEDKLKKDFEKTLMALGFPVSNYSLESYLKDLPAEESGPFQLLFMKNKLVSDQDAIKGIAEALPLIQQAIVKLKMASDKATTSQKYLKKVILEEYNRIRVRKATGQHVDAQGSTEVNRIFKAILDVKANLDTKSIAISVNKLYEALYKTQFTDDELETGYERVRSELKKTVVTQKLSMTGNNVSTHLTTIQMLNKRYLEISDKEMDITGIRWSDLGKIIDKTDADKLKTIDTYFNGVGLRAAYQDMSVDVRNFVQFCLSVTNSMMTVEKQASNLVEWHTKARLFYYNGIVGDVKELIKISDSVNNLDDHQEVKRQIKKMAKLRFIKDSEADTLQDVLSRIGAGEKIQSDIKVFDNQITNFVKQTGLGN